MMPAQITSTSNPQVKNVVTLMKKSRARTEQGLFVVEGMKLFQELPAAWIAQVYVSEGFVSDGPMDEVRKVCNPLVVSDRVFTAMADTCTPQGILALVRQPVWELEQMIGLAKSPFFLILEQLQDPGNLGTILRTAEAAGCTGIIMSRDTVDIYNPKTIRSTMGALYREPFVYVEELEEAIALLRQQEILVYAAHLKGRQYFDELSYEKGGAFLIGNEGNGLRQETAEQADIWVKIPMEGKVESLNAAVAAALLVYQASGGFRRSKRPTGP